MILEVGKPCNGNETNSEVRISKEGKYKCQKIGQKEVSKYCWITA
jgi:hypothetical protein